MKKYALILCLLNASFSSQANAELAQTVREIGVATFCVGTFSTFLAGISWAICSYQKTCPEHTHKVEVNKNYQCTSCEQDPTGKHCNQTRPGYCVESEKECQMSNGTLFAAERKECEAPKSATIASSILIMSAIAFFMGAHVVDHCQTSYEVVDEEKPIN